MMAMDNLFYRKEKPRVDIGAMVKKLRKNKPLVLALLVGIPVLVYLVFGNRGILQRVHLQEQKTEMEAKIRAAEAEQKALQAQVKALDGDKKAIEKVAREKHNMAREGEQVYRVKPE